MGSKDADLETGVDWPNLGEGILYVRDKKLNDLILSHDFIDTLYHTWLHKKPSPVQKRMLNAVLVSFCGGWGIIPPVVFSARLAATTRAPIAQCLAAGFCASGPAHTSAIQDIMEIYCKYDLDEIDGFVESTFASGGKIPGFGHPVLARDPRPATLRRLCTETGFGGGGVKKFDRIEALLKARKNIYGNVDGINGAILYDLGFEDPAFGPAFFLMGRSLSMTAHILEEYKNKPFSALDLVYPGFHKMRYKHASSISGGD